ncbi:epoxide hydrolase family protein [Amycolatopsis thermophila]|uniref:Microsomal epoxide hydrolase n=1 Tax=Amycolatopsis thermophila TaxID=206084 RepID=A0ABU0F116_9PSEU|nr:epoxide hydrolase family protein [Amycolatopsis thermophila]MDQ0380886.1 microsomal epoxide hydrolase [Amycolatopsis thermophila]
MSDIEPFHLDIPRSQLDDLHARLDLTRWPDELPRVGWDYGIPLDYLKELTRYWRTVYDWRVHERQLNELGQFTTEIDGQRIHFLHVRSADPDALPLILTHGWPGSVVEFLPVVEALSARHHLVIPSIPGYGFSGPTTETGWDVPRIARAFAELMHRLGYSRYGAQGGDWGSGISRELGASDAGHVVGVHVNMLGTAPRDTDELTGEERERLAHGERYQRELSGYMKQQSTRPQTLAYALHDSPVGQLAWIVERFKDWTDSTDAPEDAVDRDLMLTNVMIYWLTGTAGSSARLYRESGRTWRNPVRVEVPVGVAVFPHDIVLPVRRLAERDHNIVHWSEFDRGGHFAAMEEPDLLAADVLRFFGSL